MSDPVVIIGSGLAGYTLARELRKQDPKLPLEIVSRDSADFYSKPMLSNALAGNKSATALVMKSAETMAAELGATIRPHSVVTAIHPAAHLVSLQDGSTIRYGRLVLALGADPIRLPLGGDAADAVLSVNDLDDYARYAARLEGAARVLILGGGLIGCEFANDLLARGITPLVADLAPLPLGRLLPEQAGRHFRDQLAAAGVEFHTGCAAECVGRAGQGYRVTFTDGTAVSADLIVSAVGLRPRTALASAAGLATGRGILSDRLLATSQPDIYALGDCLEVEGLNLPFVLPIMQQARALAATLAGTPTPVRYPVMPVVVKTPACPTVVSPPPAGSTGEWSVEDAEEGGLVARYAAPDGRVLGFALLGAAIRRKQALAKEVPELLV